MVPSVVSLRCHPICIHPQASPHQYSASSRLSIPAFLQLQRCLISETFLLVQKNGYPIRKNCSTGVSARSGMLMGDNGDDFDEDEEDEEEDRSLDLLIRFVENVFKKVSRKARKAVKSVLPVPISTRLVGFAVNGTIILTFLWVLKAFLEVICTLGTVVFASILLIRGLWTGISYFQESRSYREDEDDPKTWRGTRPVY